MLTEKQLYWIKFIIYVGTAILTPWATLFSGMTPQDFASMEWYSWAGVAISDIIAGLVAARAYLDTTAGRAIENKEWEEWEQDVKNEVNERLSFVNAKQDSEGDTITTEQNSETVTKTVSF